VSENKLCSVFVVNAIKELSEVYDKRDGSAVCVCFFLYNCLCLVCLRCLLYTEYLVNKDYYKVSNQAKIVKSDNLLCMLFVTKTADEIAIVEQSYCLWLIGSLLFYNIFYICVVIPSIIYMVNKDDY